MPYSWLVATLLTIMYVPTGSVPETCAWAASRVSFGRLTVAAAPVTNTRSEDTARPLENAPVKV
jgi:hypothetical protein